MVARQACWERRDWIAAAALFLATAGVILWQNAHVAVLWDLSYVLDTATRVAQGQLPYRDFPFAHPPLTFLLQAALIRLFGRVFWHHALYAAVAGGTGSVLSWRILLRSFDRGVHGAWTAALLLAAPLAVLGVYCIYPLPSYDCDCALATLAAVFLLQRLKPAGPEQPAMLLRGFAAGVAICLPLFFKQNIGLPFLAACVAVLALPFAVALPRRAGLPGSASWLPVVSAALAGVAVTLGCALLLIHSTVGLANYVHWTFAFAAARRMPALDNMLGIYRDPQLLWTLPSVAAGVVLLRCRLGGRRWAQAVSIALIAAPFVFAVVMLPFCEDADERCDRLLALWPLLLILAAALAVRNLVRWRRQVSLGPFVPLILLVAIHGTLMSQQLWGSTYALWPLLLILVAGMVGYLAQGNRFAPRLAVIVASTLLVCGGIYTAREDRLSYADLAEAPLAHSAFPALKGLAVPGPYLPEFDELLRFAEAHIPSQDGVLLLPGEDPFYFATGRVPHFPVLLFDPATDPYSPNEVVALARAHGIRWLVVKRHLQLIGNPMPRYGATLNLLLADFALDTRLRGYDVYLRR